METEAILGGSKITGCRWWPQPRNWKTLAPWKKSYDQPTQHIKKQRHYFVNKGLSSQSMVFPVDVYGCESWTYKESWVPKNWCFWTVVVEKTLESPLDCKEIEPVHPKGNQSWTFIGRTDTEAETPILRPLTHWKRPSCWERLKAGGEGDDSGWDGWMASPTQWTWVWVSSGSWWWTGKPGVLQSMGFPKNRTQLSDWTELNWQLYTVYGFVDLKWIEFQIFLQWRWVYSELAGNDNAGSATMASPI